MLFLVVVNGLQYQKKHTSWNNLCLCTLNSQCQDCEWVQFAKVKNDLCELTEFQCHVKISINTSHYFYCIIQKNPLSFYVSLSIIRRFYHFLRTPWCPQTYICLCCYSSYLIPSITSHRRKVDRKPINVNNSVTYTRICPKDARFFLSPNLCKLYTRQFTIFIWICW